MEKQSIIEDRIDPIPGEYGHPIPLELFYRELGITGPVRHRVGRMVVSPTLATKAVHAMCTKPEFKRKTFQLPTGARTTFHMAFSADGSRVASCHGDHNVYVCDVATGKIIQTLTGHPRTPWCVVFHPTQNDILASGCLAGHIRVWDLKGGSEVLVTDSGTVIASLAFHPTVRLLAIATFNEIIFWDWGLAHPLARCSTQNTKEKVRLVRFDRLGHNLITGITNFPNPPTKETCAKGTQSGVGFRPNILSRRPWYGAGPPRPGNGGSFYAYPRRVPVTQDNNTAFSANSGPQSSSSTDNNNPRPPDSQTPHTIVTDRQERFQESYRQLVHHYQDLVSNYQQFLRSRIPRLLETSRVIREEEPEMFVPQIELNPNDFEHSHESSSDNSLDGTATVSLDISPNPVLVPELVPESISGDIEQLNEAMVIEDEIPGPSRLSQLEARLIEHMEAEVDNNAASATPSTSQLPVSDTANNVNNPGSSETGLQNIEALAQNIIEMQNLCSQARRDAPHAPENQHIHELQNIRRHLEVLQDQTRELQSSIRHTLSSLARGSLEVLSARAAGIDITTGTAEVMDMLPDNQAENSPDLPSIAESIRPVQVDNTTFQPTPVALTNNPESVINFAMHDHSLSLLELGRVSPTGPLILGNPSPPPRTRVPEVVPSEFDIADALHAARTINTARNPEPVPGPSRQMFPPSSTGDNTPENRRRVVREFHVVHGGRNLPGEQEHSRNCPFSIRDNLVRPPTRMRCLTEMGEDPVLTVWPTADSDQPLSTRRFANLNEVSNAVSVQRTSERSNNGNSADLGNPFYSTYPLPSFSQWMNNGPYWVNNAVGVSVFLSVRQANEMLNNSVGTVQLNESLENAGNEDWQRSFIAGLGLIPPNIREGQRQQYRRIRRGQNIIYHMSQGQGRLFTLRPSQWDEFRSNFLSPNSPSEMGSLPWNSPYLRNRPVELPALMSGNFSRSFSMRAGDEVIPVYTHTSGSADASLNQGDIRDSPIANVYTFPIGLFIEGNSFTGGPQALGIYWPPTSREEEEGLRESRRSESLIPIWSGESDQESRLASYQIDYDSYELRIRIDQDSSLIFIQPGLMLLDAVTTIANWSRPRPVAGTVFVNYLSPFLDALERLFGHRMRRSSAGFPSTSSLGSSPNIAVSPHPPTAGPSGVSGPSLRMSTVMQPTLLGTRTGSGRSISWVPIRPVNNSRSSPESPSAAEVGGQMHDAFSRSMIQRYEERERARMNPRRIISFSNGEASQSLPPGVIARNQGETLEAYRRRLYRDYLGQEVPDGGVNANGEPLPPPLTHFISVSRSSRSRSRPPGQESETGTGRATSSSTRRFIRFAVDTATAEVLRRHPNTSSHDALTLNQTVQRAIESRIERVLNERGNRGVSSQFQTAFGSAEASSSNSDTRQNATAEREPSESHTRSMLPVWANRMMSTSGTQTAQSFIRSASTSATTNSVGVGTSANSEHHIDIMRARTGRRRAYSRFSSGGRGDRADNNDVSEDESAPPLPPRIARLNTDNGFGEARNNTNNDEDFQNSDANGVASDSEGQPPGPPRRFISVLPSVDVRLARRQRSFGNSLPVPRVIVPRLHPHQGAARTEPINTGNNAAADGLLDLSGNSSRSSSGTTNLGGSSSNGASTSNVTRRPLSGQQEQPSSSSRVGALPRRIPNSSTNNIDDINNNNDPAARFYPGYIPEILITPRVRPPNYYTMDAATTAFLSSRIQKWDFSKFNIPDISKRNESIVVGECSLHSDACLDVSNDSEFLAVLQPSDNGSYSAVGIYSLRDESLGDTLYVYHFDQNTVSISISPSCDYIVVGYAGRGPFYRFVHPSRNIGQILSLTRDGNRVKLVAVKELYAESQNSLMSINCMHFVPVPGYGIIYGTNTGELVLLS